MGDCSEALSTRHVLSQYITVIEYLQVNAQKTMPLFEIHLAFGKELQVTEEQNPISKYR